METPRFVQMEPVGQCNLRCEMCPIQFRKDGPPWGPPALMRFDVFERLLDQFPGLTELHLQGLGEPMMHPRFFEMIETAVKRGVKVSVNSNCTLLGGDRAERLVSSGLHTLHVSIDGATRETYERIREGARFWRVLRGVRRVTDARARLGTPGPDLRLVMVLMRQNLVELSGIVRLAARLGIRKVFAQHLAHDFAEKSLPSHYRPMRLYVDRETLLNAEPDLIAEHFERARATASREGVDLRLPGLRMIEHAAGTPGRDRCDWPWRGAYLSYQGLAMPCCMVATPDRMNFGSMAERGVEAVWNSPEYEKFRDALGSETPPEVCRTCSIYRGTF